MPPITFLDLTTLDEFAEVVALERRIWGSAYDDVVPVPILAITVKRGAILIGAFDGARMAGFVYSVPGLRNGRPMQWSHMLGVAEEHRKAGLGRQLKLLQRERALAMGLDLIEWTFDPMQAANAHLNFARLGVVVEEYEENVYGESTSPLHKGNPTDRFVAEWRLREPHVEHRLAAAGPIPVRAAEAASAPVANRMKRAGDWLVPEGSDLSLDARCLVVLIPTGFTDMLSRAPDAALSWRFATREIFTTYFGRGYHATDFVLNLDHGTGAYLLTRG